MRDQTAKTDRVNFLRTAILFQGSLLLLALFLSWCLGDPLWAKIALSIEALGVGVVATLPMLLLLPLVYRSRLKSLVRIRELLKEVLGKQLAACNWIDLCGLAILAGVSEEFLFRGVLEPWLSRWGTTFGFVVCNILFGICHAVTPMYALVAGLMGAYLSSTLWWTNEPALMVPIVCHSLYDLVAFAVVRNSLGQIDSQVSPIDADNSQDECSPV